MRVSRLKTSILLSFLLLSLFSITITARAEDDEPDEYDVKARVVRISLIEGDVNLKRNGNKDWERIRLNYPLVEGDTVATEKDSRLEIQVDARNFVRLASNTILRIVTLRDEGIALSVVEGTATVRLAKFDAKREYFEIDAPKTTLSIEETGFYRIDVPREGRVRLTVRDGGGARIYSDTSGFNLRNGRSAELVVSGENAGDWEFFAADQHDAIDAWVSDRERYLAQRLKYDVKYYDEYVWGAEDLDAYGDWSYTDDFGWMWRPHRTAIASYNDWAPYRYGHWTWCPPYGWTWVGYEPWGWAPYHYGRWVYHNNYWAWVPRTKFQPKRSWWRPALVAFVSLNFSFGTDICWYPLSYYQRDPHSRRYRHYDRNPGYGGGRGGYGDRRPGYGGGGGGGADRRPYDGDKHWRGVTRVPRRDFGNPEGRGRGVEEPVARRVVDSAPQPGTELPRFAGNPSGGEREREQTPGRPIRRIPVVQVPDRPTGATERTPGVALDEDLRRSRVFRGREPRSAEPPAPASTTNTTAEPETREPEPETRPTGAVARPDPPSRPDRGQPRIPRQEPPQTSGETRADDPPPGRMVRPTRPEGVEKRTRTQQAIEETPRSAPAPRAEQPAAPSAPEPVQPQPQPETRPEPVQPQPRVEPRESRPEPRAEPRSEPRESRPEPRESSPEPRSEPRSEPRESRPEPRPDPPSRPDPPPRSDPPAPRADPPRSEVPHPGKPDRPRF